MNRARGVMLSLAVAMNGWACFAQQSTIPFKQIEEDAKLSTALPLSIYESSSSLDASSLSSGFASSGSSGAGFTRTTPTPVRRRSLGASFFLLNGIDFGMAVLDVEMTQRCIATHKCREGNPLMPSSHAGALSVSIGLAGVGTWGSYQMKKHHSNIWWICPTGGIAGHVIGVASGLVHR